MLDTAYELLLEVGFGSVTMEAIASRAGVSKATLYRWWSSKAEVLLDCVHERVERYPQFAGAGSTRRDLLLEIEGVIRFYRSHAGRALLDLIAHSRFNPTLADTIRDRFIQGRRDATVEVLKRGQERGEIVSGLNLQVTMDALWGALYYKLLVSHTPLTRRYASQLLDTFWPALGP